jgi:hypothetical protein
LKWGRWLKSLSAEQTNARSANRAQAALIISSMSAGDLTAVLPKPKKIGGVPAPFHDATSSSTSVGNSIVSAPTKGRWRSNFAHSAANAGKHTSS